MLVLWFVGGVCLLVLVGVFGGCGFAGFLYVCFGYGWWLF